MRHYWRTCCTTSLASGMPPILSGRPVPSGWSCCGTWGQAKLAPLLTRPLVDLDLDYAGSEDLSQCSYTRGEEVVPTCIDGVLSDTRTASGVHRLERIRNEAIPGHRPVRFDLATEAASHEVLRAIRPPQIVLPKREPDLQKPLSEALLSLYQGRWDSLLAARRVDAVWELWMWAAEESVLALSEEAMTNRGHVDRANPLPRALVRL